MHCLSVDDLEPAPAVAVKSGTKLRGLTKCTDHTGAIRVKRFFVFGATALSAISGVVFLIGSAASAQPSTPGPAWIPSRFWQVADNGYVYGSPSYGSTANFHLGKPIVGIAATPSGNGYWLVGADGGVFGFGDAGFYGSLPGNHITPQEPIVGIAPTQGGAGYWLDGSDGGVFTFGDAGFFGATPGKDGVSIVGPVFPTPDQQGYWLATSSLGPTMAEGFGDVLSCWGGTNVLSLSPPDIVGAAAVGGENLSGGTCAA